MTTNKQLLRDSNGLLFKFLGNKIVPLAALFIIGNFLSLNLEDTMVGLAPTEENLKLALNLALGLWDLTEGIVLIFLLSWAVPAVHPLKGPKFLTRPFERPYISTFMAEYLRVLGRILIWGLCLLIPGFYRYFQLIFVPVIVMFSSEYEKGEVDALALSTMLFKRCFKFLLVVLIVTTVMQFVLEFAPHMYETMHQTPARVALNLCSFLISIWSYSFILLLFEREMGK